MDPGVIGNIGLVRPSGLSTLPCHLTVATRGARAPRPITVMVEDSECTTSVPARGRRGRISYSQHVSGRRAVRHRGDQETHRHTCAATRTPERTARGAMRDREARGAVRASKARYLHDPDRHTSAAWRAAVRTRLHTQRTRHVGRTNAITRPPPGALAPAPTYLPPRLPPLAWNRPCSRRARPSNRRYDVRNSSRVWGNTAPARSARSKWKSARSRPGMSVLR